jgi:hypothetical protein
MQLQKGIKTDKCKYNKYFCNKNHNTYYDHTSYALRDISNIQMHHDSARVFPTNQQKETN